MKQMDKMENNAIINIGRKAWGICILGKGIQQIFSGTIDLIFLPSPVASHSISTILMYPWAIVFIIAGIAILINKKVYEVALISGSVFLALSIMVYAPYIIFVSKKGSVLLEWAPVVQELGFAGSSLAVAATFPEKIHTSKLIGLLEKLTPFAGILFSCPMIVFGVAHFVYAKLVSDMVPTWIPFSLFWTYFTGIALISAGLSISLNLRIKLAASLLALMIFTWLLMLHIPRSFSNQPEIKALEISRVFVTIGYTGVALLFAYRNQHFTIWRSNKINIL